MVSIATPTPFDPAPVIVGSGFYDEVRMASRAFFKS
eukprot:CAMPEP_0176111064 /NCGR_PEP_ID=MMETSP0120_2-20121206/55771_1 /TAXON_ID=160619 /ORGANISM="Kryptoperidinium foliaceum, Strain CCMP 1326" /LENGTH=35 /DNA_ID= /DNA_START= /DNA_END= /DNA_ORIENTATION=